MEAKWLSRCGSSQLIIFFCGWGFDERCVAHLAVSPYDVVVLFDYREAEMPSLPLAEYSRITLVAWSFGVWVAGAALASGRMRADEAYAINGTLVPVSDTLGIPSSVFEATVAGLSEASLQKFYMRICGGVRSYSAMKGLLPLRRFEEQRCELEILGRRFAGEGALDPSVWTAALITRHDLIFPFGSMKRFWGDRAVERDGVHLCFADDGSWSDLLSNINKQATNE